MKITGYNPEFSFNLVSGSVFASAGGDLSGQFPGPLVTGIWGVSIACNTAPTTGQVLTALSPTLIGWATSSNSASFGSNSTRVSANPSAGASSSNARADHIHDGIGTVTASSSNTLDRGTFNLRPGSNITFGLTDSDGSGGFDTLTINGGAGSGGVSSIAKSGSAALTGAVTLTGGSNVTLTQSGNDISIAATGGGGSGPSGSKPVQSKTQNGSTNTNSLAVTLGSTPTNGNLLILVSGRDDNGTISSITQTNVVWTQLATSTAAPRVEVWKGVVSASASSSITVAYSTSTFSQYVVAEFAGLAGTFGASAIISGSTVLASRPMTPTIVPASASMLVIGGMTTTSNGNDYASLAMGNLLVVEGMFGNSNRMLAVYGFPGTVPAYAIASVANASTLSGVVVTLT